MAVMVVMMCSADLPCQSDEFLPDEASRHHLLLTGIICAAAESALK